MTEQHKRGHNLKAGSPDGDRGRMMGAPLGWKALVAKKGIKKAHATTRQWNLDHPTALERKVMAALDEMGVKYLREYEVSLEPVYVRCDFKVKWRKVVVEVDGEYSHRNDAERQARREAVIKAAGLRLVRLPEAVVVNGHLRQVLERELKL